MADKNPGAEHDEGFSPDWLRLREPADHIARSASLTKQLAQWRKSFTEFNIVDLGSGTASNLRYLCPALGMNQSWTLLDNDVGLLSCIAERLASWATDSDIEFRETCSNSASLNHANFSAKITWQQCDLAEEINTHSFDNTHLITGSALLDLTSAEWIAKLSTLINTQQCASLFVLNYNGRIQWQPSIGSDATVTNLLNAHQLKDKGFGNALGPAAYKHFQSQLTNASIETETTNWLLEPQNVAIQKVLVNDWASAAVEQNPALKLEIEDWSCQRLKHLASEESSLQVGHTDVLSLPLENKQQAG